ncbi:UDP-glycosyltransferase 76E4-like [Eucalyptus grandis]|uniref:UDP-glycosyltransferase 76E4-like n=1 Tax=Eucalyptus grandis TaxID=71139 RepID=UPI00192EA996|nr:UDP-glycosyltransferase 76E4-like [Eucalyptus grandis]
MLQLATVLKSKDFSITVAHAHFNSLDYSVFPDFTFLCIPDGLSEEEVQNPDLKAIILRLNVNRESSLREYLTRSTNHMGPGDKICCIIYDAVVYFLEAVAHDLKIPSIALHSSSAAPTIVHPILLQVKAFRSQALVPLHQLLRFKDLPLSSFGSLDYFLELVVLTSNMRSSLAIIFNTIHCLEESPLAQLYQQYQVPIFPIGPPHKLAPTSAVSLLRKYWFMRQWEGFGATVDGTPPWKVYVKEPCFGEQKVNAMYLTHEWRVGLELEGEIERGTVERAVRKLMKEKEGEEMRQRVLDLKHKCDVSIGDGGSSCHYLSKPVELLRSF